MRLPETFLRSADDFLERTILRLGIDLSLVQGKQVAGKFPQCLEFTSADVRSLVLQETEHEEPSVAPVGRQHDPGTAALSAAWHSDALLQYTAAQVAIDQALLDFLDCRPQC
jgi:hypothetical protein